MAKLISLQGAICTFKLDKTYTCNESFPFIDTTNVVLKFTTSTKNYNGIIINGDSSFNTTNCKLVTDDGISFVGYGANYGYNKYIYASFHLDDGYYNFYDLTSLILDFTNSNISEDTLTDQQLIDVLVANCDIEGGIYESSGTTYEVLYNDEVVATVTPGDKVVIHCAGDIMDYSLVVRPVFSEPEESPEEPITGPVQFTIAGVTYYADNNMTWAEWCSSAYNTGGYTSSGSHNSISGPGGIVQSETTHSQPLGGDIIVADTYGLSQSND